MIIYINIINSK